MTQGVQSIAQTQSGSQPVSKPLLWGLTAGQLHDAFWCSRGVQCIRRGQRRRLQKGAELFLLIEPDQLVLFNVAQLTERLTWHNAAVTRLRLVVETSQPYAEHVVVDERGLVQRIERRYRPRILGYSRLLLTSSRRAASIWMSAKSWRDGWDRVRRSVLWSRVDHWRCPGQIFNADDPQQQRMLIDELVETWRYPNQAITGLEEIEPGVWHLAGEPVPEGVVRVGPLWLGRGANESTRRCIVGPAWIEDRVPVDATADLSNRLKEIIDIVDPQPDLPQVGPSKQPVHQFAKRAFDIVVSLVALLLLAPVMAAIAILVMVEDGRPIFFGHRRQTRDGRVFRCWKFRTMQPNAERIARQLENFNLCDGPQINIPNDPRVTRVGRFLRATNLDELPQFWNVLLGHMSLVGPRPSPDDENQYCPAWRDLRLSVRPGITGLWQLNRTREPGEDFQEWIKYDIEYVQKASFWLDLKILWRTAKLLLMRRVHRAAQKES